MQEGDRPPMTCPLCKQHVAPTWMIAHVEADCKQHIRTTIPKYEDAIWNDYPMPDFAAIRKARESARGNQKNNKSKKAASPKTPIVNAARNVLTPSDFEVASPTPANGRRRQQPASPTARFSAASASSESEPESPSATARGRSQASNHRYAPKHPTNVIAMLENFHAEKRRSNAMVYLARGEAERLATATAGVMDAVQVRRWVERQRSPFNVARHAAADAAAATAAGAGTPSASSAQVDNDVGEQGQMVDDGESEEGDEENVEE